MEECDYCGATFDDEAAHLRHLRDEHYEELGRIDRRRVDDLGDEGAELDPGPVLILLIVGISVAVVLYLFFFVADDGNANPAEGSGAAQTPYGSAHEHGTMEVVVLDEAIDFSQQQYQERDPDFHFENGEGRIWHTHAEGVTVEYALATLGIDVAGDSVTVEGTTYAEPEYEVRITVDGEPVDPATYVLDGVADPADAEQGDHVRIVIEESD